MATSQKAETAKPRPSVWEPVLPYLVLPVWTFGLILAALWLPFGLALVSIHLIPGSVVIGLFVAAMAVPLQVRPPGFARSFLRLSFDSAHDYFPIKFHYVDRRALDGEDAPYVIGYEPHSVLPLAMSFFSKYGQEACEDMAPVLANTRVLVSSAGFWAPVTRHLWWWLGCRPVSRASFSARLRRGHNIILCPGGVQECIYMGPGVEIAYLRRRHGFVRLAIQHGAPLVPVFAFGQSKIYRYVRFFIDWPSKILPKTQYLSFVRRIGYVPMLMFGVFGTAMPCKETVDVVIGVPIPTPKVEHPSPELVQEYLDKFIQDMQSMFEEHKKKLGYDDLELLVY